VSEKSQHEPARRHQAATAQDRRPRHDQTAEDRTPALAAAELQEAVSRGRQVSCAPVARPASSRATPGASSTTRNASPAGANTPGPVIPSDPTPVAVSG